WGEPWTGSIDGAERLNPNDPQQRQDVTRMLREQLGETRGSEVANLLGPSNPRNLLELAVRTNLKSSELEAIEPYLRVERVAQQGQPPPAPSLKVNINAAPREVLQTLEGLSSTDADTL